MKIKRHYFESNDNVPNKQIDTLKGA